MDCPSFFTQIILPQFVNIPSLISIASYTHASISCFSLPFPLPHPISAQKNLLTFCCQHNLKILSLQNFSLLSQKQAEEHFERPAEQMRRSQSITEQSKPENALEWGQRMNNIRVCAKGIVEKDFDQLCFEINQLSQIH